MAPEDQPGVESGRWGGQQAQLCGRLWANGGELGTWYSCTAVNSTTNRLLPFFP